VPDKRRHRGAHPEDPRCFGPAQVETLRSAASELSWLLDRGYPPAATLELVGNRHALVHRQRAALARGTCAAGRARERRSRALPWYELRGLSLAVDGFNCLIGTEVALGGGVIVVGLDGAHRDLGSVHGTYRTVEETEPASSLLVAALATARPRELTWFFDSPVSNSGRIANLLRRKLAAEQLDWDVQLVPNADVALLEPRFEVVVSSDGAVIDRAPHWFDAVGHLVSSEIPGALCVDLRDQERRC
jgi:hypothetical protein